MMPVYYAIPFFLVTMIIEWAILRREQKSELAGYTGKDSAASIAMGLGNVGVSVAFKIVSVGFFVLLSQFAVFEMPMTAWWAWVLLFVIEDFCYYWFHRAGHEVRFFWAAHVNHHSSTHYNLSTALRQSWTTPITGPLFWAPLPLLGFSVEMILIAQSVSLLYQFWLHTELIGSMGPFGWVFNTPSHHRVHHGRNTEYLDRNHAGILVIWDRLFGTFEPEVAPVDYGLTTNLDTYNPVRIAFHEWAAMFRDVAHGKTLRGKLGYLFCPPGWREDGTGKTSKVLRQELAERRSSDAPALVAGARRPAGPA